MGNSPATVQCTLHPVLPLAAWLSSQLEVLDLHGTNISGHLPQIDSSAPLYSSLKQLFLHKTGLSGSADVVMLPNLTAITIWSTKLCGHWQEQAVSGPGGLCVDTTNTFLGESVAVAPILAHAHALQLPVVVTCLYKQQDILSWLCFVGFTNIQLGIDMLSCHRLFV